MILAATTVIGVIVTLLVLTMVVCAIVGSFNPWGAGLDLALKGVAIFFAGVFILAAIVLAARGCAA